jgi:glycosyltransferase involved in cell wall biosynthesis
MNNRILMLVNIFPPSGESGVQRPVKFLKYFAKNGWETFVITPRTPVNRRITDVTLEKEVPSGAKIFKTLSLGISEDNLTDVRFDLALATRPWKKLLWKLIKPINDILFPIDKQIGWVPFAVVKAIHVIIKYKIRNVYITAFPFSSFLCGLILKKIFGNKIFWVADYRDAWQFAPLLKKNVLPFRYRFICRMDQRFLHSADYAVFTSPHVLNYYLEKYHWLDGKAECITNGYDEDDFTNINPQKFSKFTFVYMGKIYDDKRNPIHLLKAIQKFMNEDFQYVHIGTIGKSVLKQIEDNNFQFYQFQGYKSHQEAIAYSLGADINILIKINEPDAEGPIPGKLFELLRIGKPILYVGPQQKFIIDLLTATGAGVYAKADDADDIARALKELFSEDFRVKHDKQQIEQYSRASLTKMLESIYLRKTNK